MQLEATEFKDDSFIHWVLHIDTIHAGTRRCTSKQTLLCKFPRHEIFHTSRLQQANQNNKKGC